MKKGLIFWWFMAMIGAFAVVGIYGEAMAESRYVDVTVTADPQGNVTIGEFPAGATFVNVHVWNDCRGSRMRALGPVKSFQLKPCEGFNFLWKDNEGTWYQMITPRSSAGGSLVVDCSASEECKYLFPDDAHPPATTGAGR